MYRSQRKTALSVLAIALAIGAAGCTNNNGSGSTPNTPTPNLVTETFSGSITQGGSVIQSFTVANSGYNLLAGFTAIGPSNVTALGLGIANYDPTSSTCGLNLPGAQNSTATVGSTGVTGTANSGPYCVRVYDGGNVPAGTTVTFTAQVQHY
jgi:hypothetical protein